MSQTIAEIYARILPIVNQQVILPKTTNKGKPGQHLEDLLGIPHTSNCLDCADGELKLFPVKRLKNGTLVPAETIAVTMLSTDDLRNSEFSASRCCKKMSRMMVVPYFRTGDVIQFMMPTIVDKECDEYTELYSIFEADYDAIRAQFVETGVLKSETGVLLQNRTKGAGHGTTSRAYYLRPEFMKRYVKMIL